VSLLRTHVDRFPDLRRSFKENLMSLNGLLSHENI
jgi:hypothetical protein